MFIYTIGVTAFLRLAWAFTLALNAFSLTTLADPPHRKRVITLQIHNLNSFTSEVISIVLFSTNAAAFVFLVVVGTFEAFRFRIASWTSRVGFELAWISLFWILETGELDSTCHHRGC